LPPPPPPTLRCRMHLSTWSLYRHRCSKRQHQAALARTSRNLSPARVFCSDRTAASDRGTPSSDSASCRTASAHRIRCVHARAHHARTLTTHCILHKMITFHHSIGALVCDVHLPPHDVSHARAHTTTSNLQFATHNRLATSQRARHNSVRSGCVRHQLMPTSQPRLTLVRCALCDSQHLIARRAVVVDARTTRLV
jgi:hypothetical protein